MKRRRRRSSVRWLPDNSWLSTLTGLAFNTAGPVYEHTFSDQIVLGGTPDELITPGTTGWPQNFNREENDALIVDHIKGQIHIGWEGNSGGEGAADADGTWIHVVRAAIWIGSEATLSGGGPANVSLGTETTNSGDIIPPGANVPVFLQGSFVPDGVRILWRRSFLWVNAWSADEADAWFGTSNLTPPSGYVDIKPKRLLRPNEALNWGVHVQAHPTILAGPGAGTGTLRCWVGQDLRVAAHNTKRRR